MILTIRLPVSEGFVSPYSNGWGFGGLPSEKAELNTMSQPN